MTSIEKWQKAVVHLEGAADSIPFERKQIQIQQIQQKMGDGEYTDQEYMEMISSIMNQGSRDIRSQGTAVFVEDEGRKYLITARHVIEDTTNNGSDKIFNNIFRVISLDLSMQENAYHRDTNLVGLNSGPEEIRQYTLSIEHDLAVISLDSPGTKFFADDLIKDGYVPVSLNDIQNVDIDVGQDIISIGFPGITSLVGQRELHPAQRYWASSSISVPIASFGKIGMSNQHLDFYWADISIYPGNSGGPVVSNDKLVGIVSAQPGLAGDVYETENGQKVNLQVVNRVPFGMIVKSKYIFELIKIQREKDNRFR